MTAACCGLWGRSTRLAGRLLVVGWLVHILEGLGEVGFAGNVEVGVGLMLLRLDGWRRSETGWLGCWGWQGLGLRLPGLMPFGCLSCYQ